MTASAASVLDIDNLHLEFRARGATVKALAGVTLTVGAREIVGIVGESGSGKSVTALSVMGLLPASQVVITAGTINFQGDPMLKRSERQLRKIRGRDIAMIFQEPMTALNPVKRVSQQVVDIIGRLDPTVSRRDAKQYALSLFQEMHIRDAERVFNAYPHELSGGLRQRVLIAMAFASKPKLLIADEPTTALDVTTQAQILSLLKDQAEQKQTAVMFISHDLAVVAGLCDRIYIMSKGVVVESGATLDVIRQPQDPYTRALLKASPEGKPPRSRLSPRATADESIQRAGRSCPGASAVPLVQLDGVTVEFAARGSFLRPPTLPLRAVDHVNLTVHKGETLSVVGESGSGKTTLAKAIVGLVPVSGGTMAYSGQRLVLARDVSMRKHMQMVFQDPQSSLNPRHRAWRVVTEPLRVQRTMSKRDCMERARALLERVGLRADQLERFPHEFSGGERQRLAIARALSVEPDLLVLDEPTSALDVSVQAQILDLLVDLQDAHDLTYLFISHDVAVVRHISDRVAVMHEGRLVESGSADAVLNTPQEDYTRVLVGSVPKLFNWMGAPAARG